MVAFPPRCDYGVTCVRCGYDLIAPESSEFVSERLVLNLWSCAECGYWFETEAYIPADAKPLTDAETMEMFFPSLLVA